MGLFTRHDDNTDRTQRFLGPDSDIAKLISIQLDESLYHRLKAIYEWKGKSPLPNGDEFIHGLVSNTVCADLLDYLARDHWHCNLDLIDTEYRLLTFLYLGQVTVKDKETEWETETPQWVFELLWPLTDGRRVIKTRYSIPSNELMVEVDVFEEGLLGLVTVECEFTSEDEAREFTLPDWVGHGRDVTADKRYKNRNLAVRGVDNN